MAFRIVAFTLLTSRCHHLSLIDQEPNCLSGLFVCRGGGRRRLLMCLLFVNGLSRLSSLITPITRQLCLNPSLECLRPNTLSFD